jgi:hypothetical protein
MLVLVGPGARHHHGCSEQNSKQQHHLPHVRKGICAYEAGRDKAIQNNSSLKDSINMKVNEVTLELCVTLPPRHNGQE